MRATNYGEGGVNSMRRCAFLIVLLAVSTAAAGGFGFDFDGSKAGRVVDGGSLPGLIENSESAIMARFRADRE